MISFLSTTFFFLQNSSKDLVKNSKIGIRLALFTVKKHMWHKYHENFQNSITDFALSITFFSNVKVNYNIRLLQKHDKKHSASIIKMIKFQNTIFTHKICVYALLENHRKHFFFLFVKPNLKRWKNLWNWESRFMILETED